MRRDYRPFCKKDLCTRTESAHADSTRSSTRQADREQGQEKARLRPENRASKAKKGDKVLLYDESLRRGRSRKLSAQWAGPYEVLAVDGVNATIKRGKNTTKFHVNGLKPFFYMGPRDDANLRYTKGGSN
jgi:hypothetical protein